MNVQNVELTHHEPRGQETLWYFYRYELAGRKRSTQRFAAKTEADHRRIILAHVEELEHEAETLRFVLLATDPEEVD